MESTRQKDEKALYLKRRVPFAREEVVEFVPVKKEVRFDDSITDRAKSLDSLWLEKDGVFPKIPSLKKSKEPEISPLFRNSMLQESRPEGSRAKNDQEIYGKKAKSEKAPSQRVTNAELRQIAGWQAPPMTKQGR